MGAWTQFAAASFRLENLPNADGYYAEAWEMPGDYSGGGYWNVGIICPESDEDGVWYPIETDGATFGTLEDAQKWAEEWVPPVKVPVSSGGWDATPPF